MKQNLKIGLFLVLTLFIYCTSSQWTTKDNNKVSLPTYHQDKCWLSQDYPENNTLESLYHLHSIPSCDMSHTDMVHVPSDKSILLLIAYISNYTRPTKDPFYTIRQHSTCSFNDPIDHYIYGLRKIII